ncbi:hypothetical protein P5673_012308 [Acropora cervicornis]|uniref:Uncharacterized protein n=1 Tax=Acropora cervicornis TaxID=6130 RepID=A0AAD9QMQ4_ACRCE|nr:hypothetical protein P5673_012308 [Acropora cervicornis]
MSLHHQTDKQLDGWLGPQRSPSIDRSIEYAWASPILHAKFVYVRVDLDDMYKDTVLCKCSRQLTSHHRSLAWPCKMKQPPQVMTSQQLHWLGSCKENLPRKLQPLLR